MLFNSLSFLLFLIVVFSFHWFLLGKNVKRQNLLLLVASYFFYGCWDYRFLFLLVFSTLLDYASGIQIDRSANNAKRIFFFWLSIIVNLGLLIVFKYYNFFIDSAITVFDHLNIHVGLTTLNIILPIGISFYTFHGLSYVIDIYYKRITPERNFVDYSLFVSYFPLLVAGPIERATHLLPQLKKYREFDYTMAVSGLKLILWGLFKKMVIADNCAEIANNIFGNYLGASGSTLLIGAFFFTFQIYCDFSGYSDIASGTSKLFGISLLRNFSYPYFSRDIAEFWRRWHISLSSWFKDYLYIPLGGSKVNTWLKVRNTWIIFLVSGFWHGANWTFLIWGALNALYITPSIIFNTNRKNIEIVAKGHFTPGLRDAFKIFGTFFLTVIAWIFFRSETLQQAAYFIIKIFSRSLFEMPSFAGKRTAITTAVFIALLILIEWRGRELQNPLENVGKHWARYIRWSFYLLLIYLMISFYGNQQQFIYFQF